MAFAQKHRPPKQQTRPQTATTTTTPTETIQILPLSLDTAQIQRTQSLEGMKILLKTSIAGIAWLRGFLHEDNFYDATLTPLLAQTQTRPKATAENAHQTFLDANGEPLMSQMSEGDLKPVEPKRKGMRGSTVKLIKRGMTPEGDTILDWIEEGLYDAIARGYLKTCILGIYLDKDDPSNLVEAYTISCHYPTIPGTNLTEPRMSIVDSINNITIGDNTVKDAAAGSSKGPKLSLTNGRTAQTVAELKKSIRGITKILCSSCGVLDELPAPPLVTMKIYYTDETPAGYEPPCFKRDDGSIPWHFATDDPDKGPDRQTFGHVHTNYHAMSFRVSTIADQLPATIYKQREKPEANDEVEEGVLGKRRRDDETLLRKDAIRRKYLWSAERDANERQDIDPSYRDADGETDPDLSQNQPPTNSQAPEFVRGDDGQFVPYEPAQLQPTLQDDAMQQEDEIVEDEQRNDKMDVDVAVAGSAPDVIMQDAAGSNEDAENDDQDPIESFDQERHPLEQIRAAKNKLAREKNEICLCDDRKSDALNVQCDSCDCWTHAHCAGYSREQDLPETYICLLCIIKLEDDFDENQFKTAQELMPRFCTFRRALRMLYDQNGSNFDESKLKKAMGLAASRYKQEAQQLVDRLKHERFLIESLEAVKKGKGRPLKQKYTINRSSEQLEKLAEYASPGGVKELEVFGVEKRHFAKHNQVARNPPPTQAASSTHNAEDLTLDYDDNQPPQSNDQIQPAAGMNEEHESIDEPDPSQENRPKASIVNAGVDLGGC